MKIVIVQHRNDFEGGKRAYFIELIADYWRGSGHEVIFINGLHENITADVALLHVNLSIVPDEYLKYAKRFPIVLNQNIHDIRKRQISRMLIHSKDHFEGPVIVKTDLNSAGYPEYMFLNRPIPYMRTPKNYWRSIVRNGTKLLKKLKFIEQSKGSLKNSLYRGTFEIFKNIHSVPLHIWENEDWIVEKFLPEMERSRFVVRNAYFLGKRMTCFKNLSIDPIIKDDAEEGTSEIIPIDERVIQYRDYLRLDYGKIDYVMHNDVPIILDVAKTMGGAFGHEAAKYLAPGIDDYFVHQKKFA